MWKNRIFLLAQVRQKNSRRSLSLIHTQIAIKRQNLKESISIKVEISIVFLDPVFRVLRSENLRVTRTIPKRKPHECENQEYSLTVQRLNFQPTSNGGNEAVDVTRDGGGRGLDIWDPIKVGVMLLSVISWSSCSPCIWSFSSAIWVKKWKCEKRGTCNACGRVPPAGHLRRATYSQRDCVKSD